MKPLISHVWVRTHHMRNLQIELVRSNFPQAITEEDKARNKLQTHIQR